MARKTKEEAQETRNNILEAAASMFVERGVVGTSLEEIAEKAGVTRGAIYWHFKNKCDIFEALHEEFHSSMLEMILEDLENDHPEPLVQLEELCVSVLQAIDGDPQKTNILKIFLLKCDYSGDMECFLHRQNDRKATNIELIARYFERARSKGRLHPQVSPDILTISLFCYVTGIMHEYLRNPNLFNLETQAPQLLRHFFMGLSAE